MKRRLRGHPLAFMARKAAVRDDNLLVQSSTKHGIHVNQIQSRYKQWLENACNEHITNHNASLG